MSIDEERRKFLGRIGKKGGRLGGKRSLETMTKAARIARAYNAGKQGGAPVKIDHAKVLELRAAGKDGPGDRGRSGDFGAERVADPRPGGKRKK